MLAEMDGEAGIWIGVATAVGTAAGFIIKAVSDAMKTKAETRAKVASGERADAAAARKDTVAEWQSYAAALVAHNDRQESTISQYQVAIDALMRDKVSYREEVAEQRQCIYFLYDHVKRLHKMLKTGVPVDPGELPELPPMHQRELPGQDSRFLANQAIQSAELLKQSGKVILPPTDVQQK
jgi:hypothetical protein